MKSKLYLAMVVILGLTACRQVINQGPVGGADLVVTNLRTGAEAYNVQNATGSRESIIAEGGDAAWDNANDVQRLRKLGKHVFTKNDFDPDTWYLMTASGGRDYDTNRDGVVDNDTGTQVDAPLRAVVRGELLNRNFGFVINPMSESAYRFLADYVIELSNDEIEQALNELAPELVGDSDNSGTVDYIDVLFANQIFNTDKTLASQVGAVSSLADALATGDPESTLNQLSRALYSTNAPNVVAEKRYESTISQQVVLNNGCGPGCHYPGGSGNASRNKLVSTTDPDYVAKNTQNFRDLVNSSLGVDGVLAHVRGIGHGGGLRIRDTDPEYDDFEAWLNLL